MFSKYATFADDAILRYVHHLRKDAVSYSNFLHKSNFQKLLCIQSAGFFPTCHKYFCERKGLNSYQIIHTLEGTGYLIYEDKEYFLTAGDTVFIDCRKYHKFCPKPQESWVFQYVHIAGSVAKQLYEESASSGFTVFHVGSCYNVEESIYNILTSMPMSTAGNDLINFQKVITLLSTCIMQSKYDESHCLPHYVYRALDYIQDNFQQQVRLDDVAGYVHVSKYHLSREFKKYVGVSIQDYLIKTRISYAENLLIHTNMSIESISETCGMSSCSHFIRTFKQKIQKTPLQYRKKWGTNNMVLR